MDADSISSAHDASAGLHDYRFDNQSDKTVVVLLEEADAVQRWRPQLQQQFNGGCLSEEIVIRAGRAVSRRMKESAVTVSAAFLVDSRYHVFKQRIRLAGGSTMVVLNQHYLEPGCTGVQGPSSLLDALRVLCRAPGPQLASAEPAPSSNGSVAFGSVSQHGAQAVVVAVPAHTLASRGLSPRSETEPALSSSYSLPAGPGQCLALALPQALAGTARTVDFRPTSLQGFLPVVGSALVLNCSSGKWEAALVQGVAVRSRTYAPGSLLVSNAAVNSGDPMVIPPELVCESSCST